jgi:hypothetical protein
VREQFLVELTGQPDETGRHHVGDLLELNRLFTAWVETVYHRQIHSETGQAPLARWADGGPFPLPTPAALAEAFLWEERRTVTKTATVSLHGNVYQVDALLVGRRVELVFDPFDLTDIDIRYGGRCFGKAVAFTLGRHAHPKARPEHPDTPAEPSGIDYLRLLDLTPPSSWNHGSTTPPCSTAPPATTPATPIVPTPAAVVRDAATTAGPLGLYPPAVWPGSGTERAAPTQRPQ